MLLGLLGVACAAAPAPAPEVLTVQEAALTLEDGSTLRMAQATMDRDGVGQGTTVSATASGKPPLNIQAPSSEWDLRSHVAVFHGPVTATRADVTLTCETLTVTFAGARRVRTAEAAGSVVVLQGERRATGDRAVLDADTGEIVLTGSPRVAEGSNQLTGQKITLLLDGEKVRCDQCQLVVDGDAVAPR